MSNFLTRTLTGIVYVVIVVCGVVWADWLFVLLMGFFAFFGVREFLQMTKVGSISTEIIASLSLLAILMLGFDMAAYISIGIPLLYPVFILAILSFLLIFIRSNHLALAGIGTLGVLYVVTPLFVLLTWRYTSGEAWNAQYLLLGFFVLIWMNDTGAYLVGRWLGKTPLAPSISPKKTWEGFVGGLLTALLFACLLFITMGQSLLIWIVMAAISVIFGTFGDLLESSLKRRAGIKDSGSILPGHGGVLDRIDSILVAAPFVFAYLLITFTAITS